MKTFIALFFTLFLGVAVFAQTPQSFRYQAVARDNSGAVLANKTVSFRMSILGGSVAGTTVYSETHTGKATNAFGLVELEIGKGTPVTGTFSVINWGNNSYFVKVEMDPSGGSAYQTLSTSQLLSVPYALHAKTVETGDNWGTQNVVTDVTLTGAGTTASNLKLAQQSAISGQVLKWNGTKWLPSDDNGSLWQKSGYHVYYDNGNVGIGTNNPQYQLHLNSHGIFSGILMTNDASGTTMDDGLVIGLQYQSDEPVNRYATFLNKENSPLLFGTNNNYQGDMTILPGGNIGIGINPPTARLDVNGQIRIRGGAPETGRILTSDAVGLASWQNVSINVDGNNFSGDGSSASPLKMKQMGASNGQVLKWNGSMWWPYNDNAGISLPYFEKCSTNVGFVINNEQGIAIEGLAASTANTGTGTGVMGESRKEYGTGVYALASSTGNGTTYALKAESKSSNGFGLWAAASHTSGNNYGVWGSSSSSKGHGIIGENSSSTGTTYGVRGIVSSSGGFSGHFSGGKFYVSGRVGLGTLEPDAGLHLKGTSFPNSFMFIESNAGQDAGVRLYEGSTVKWHIFNNSALAGLQIYNNSGNNAIFCKQSNSFVGLGTTDPTQKLHVVGNAYKTEGGTAWATSSDLRLKTILGNYEKGLDEIAALQTVRFVYNEQNPRQLTAGIEQVGFVAQEVQKVFPEAVSEAEDGYLDFNIHAINVALVNAIKELKAENVLLKKRIEQIEALTGYNVDK